MQSKQTNSVSLKWFGGEPLINIKPMDTICSILSAHGVTYASGMVTNGFLLDKEMIAHAKKHWNLTVVQITLDGTEKIYNKTKNFVSYSVNPYERVLYNIRLLLEASVRVRIRLNLSEENGEDLLRLIDQLSKQFSSYENCVVYPALLYEYHADLNNASFSQEALLERYRQLNSAIRCAHLAAPPSSLAFPKINHCTIDSDGNYIIMPDGKITKCEHHFNNHIIGTVKDGAIKEDATLKEYTPSSALCQNCEMYPTCLRPKNCPVESGSSFLKREIKRDKLIDFMKYIWHKKG